MSRHPKEDLLYDGDELHWYGVGIYPATSGLPAYQSASQQTVKNAGPIPEGLFSLLLVLAGRAQVVNVRRAQLDTRQGIQSLEDMPGPDGRLYNSEEWGRNRVRLNALYIKEPKARNRGGFYIHDSTKGYTHGCIEVDPSFFVRLREHAKAERSRKHGRRELILKVGYPSKTESTYGGTAVGG